MLSLGSPFRGDSIEWIRGGQPPRHSLDEMELMTILPQTALRFDPAIPQCVRGVAR